MNKKTKEGALIKAGRVADTLINSPLIKNIIAEKSGIIRERTLDIYGQVLDTPIVVRGFPVLVRAALLIACEEFGIKISVNDAIQGKEYLDAGVIAAKKEILNKFPSMKIEQSNPV